MNIVSTGQRGWCGIVARFDIPFASELPRSPVQESLFDSFGCPGPPQPSPAVIVTFVTSCVSPTANSGCSPFTPVLCSFGAVKVAPGATSIRTPDGTSTSAKRCRPGAM